MSLFKEISSMVVCVHWFGKMPDSSFLRRTTKNSAGYFNRISLRAIYHLDPGGSMSKFIDQVIGLAKGYNREPRPDIASPAFDDGYKRGMAIPGDRSEDLEILNLMTGSNSHMASVDKSQPRKYQPASLFARECVIAYMMGFDDGKIGRPRPEQASLQYENGYEMGTLKSIIGPETSRRHKRSKKPKNRSHQKNPFAA
jgi:hypothetical protein